MFILLPHVICDNFTALQTPTTSLPAEQSLPLSARVSAATLFMLLAVAALWFVLCRHLSGEWAINEQYSYGWFVPFFAAYLFWLRWETRLLARAGFDGTAAQSSGVKVGRREHQQRPPTTGLFENGGRCSAEHSAIRLWQFAIVAALLLLLLPVRLFEIGNPDWRPLGWLHAGIVVALTLLLIHRLGGAAWVRHFAFPVAFIFVAVPWVSAVEQPIIQSLMRGVAAIAAETLNLLGTPAQLEGSLIRVNTGLVGVNEACSGVRSLQTSIMIGLLFGELKRLRLTSRIALLGGALAIALLANCARALFLVWIAATDQVSAVSRWHDLAGYVIVGAVFIGTMIIAALLSRKADGTGSSQEAPVASQRQRQSWLATLPSTTAAVICLASIIAVEVLAQGWYAWHERDLVPVATWNVRFPETAPGFRKIDIDEAVRSTLRFDAGQEASWTLSRAGEAAPAPGASPRVFAYYFRWNAGGSSVLRARAHRPDICLPNAGWEQIADRGSSSYATSGNVSIPVREVTFRQTRANATAHTFFCLQEDQRRPSEARPDLQLAAGEQPDWSLAGRTRVVLHGVRNLGQQVLEVVIVGGETLDAAQAEEQFRQLLQNVVVPAKSR